MVSVQIDKKQLQGRHYGEMRKYFKILPDISFDSRFQLIALSSLLLFSSARY